MERECFVWLDARLSVSSSNDQALKIRDRCRPRSSLPYVQVVEALPVKSSVVVYTCVYA
jgi:hypothetical protein